MARGSGGAPWWLPNLALAGLQLLCLGLWLREAAAWPILALPFVGSAYFALRTLGPPRMRGHADGKLAASLPWWVWSWGWTGWVFVALAFTAAGAALAGDLDLAHPLSKAAATGAFACALGGLIAEWVLRSRERGRAPDIVPTVGE